MVIPLKFKGESENTHSPYLSVSGTAARCDRSPYGFSPSLDILSKPVLSISVAASFPRTAAIFCLLLSDDS